MASQRKAAKGAILAVIIAVTVAACLAAAGWGWWVGHPLYTDADGSLQHWIGEGLIAGLGIGAVVFVVASPLARAVARDWLPPFTIAIVMVAGAAGVLGRGLAPGAGAEPSKQDLATLVWRTGQHQEHLDEAINRGEPLARFTPSGRSDAAGRAYDLLNAAHDAYAAQMAEHRKACGLAADLINPTLFRPAAMAVADKRQALAADLAACIDSVGAHMQAADAVLAKLGRDGAALTAGPKVRAAFPDVFAPSNQAYRDMETRRWALQRDVLRAQLDYVRLFGSMRGWKPTPNGVSLTSRADLEAFQAAQDRVNTALRVWASTPR